VGADVAGAAGEECFQDYFRVLTAKGAHRV
jgi:hypothetical protein